MTDRRPQNLLPVFRLQAHLSNFPADWEKYGRAAGAIRNQQMLIEGKPDLVIAFPGGRGTADMVRRSKAAGIPVREIDAAQEKQG